MSDKNRLFLELGKSVFFHREILDLDKCSKPLTARYIACNIIALDKVIKEENKVNEN